MRLAIIYMWWVCVISPWVLWAWSTLQKYFNPCFTLRSWFPVTQTAFIFGHSWLLFGETQLFLSKAKPRCVSGFSSVQGLLIVGATVETASSFLPFPSLPQPPCISPIRLQKAWRTPWGQALRTCRVSPRCRVLLKQAFNNASQALFYFGHFEPEKSPTNN